MFDLPGHILILTGSPGAGKSTAARSLVSASRGSAVHPHSDDFWHYIRNGAIAPWLPEAQQQNEVVMAVLGQAAEAYAEGGYFVALDGIVGPWLLDAFPKLKQPLHYIVLRPPLAAALERCRQRGGDTLTDPGPISALHERFSALEKLENHVIETSGHTPEETLAAIEASLVSGRFRLGASS